MGLIYAFCLPICLVPGHEEDQCFSTPCLSTHPQRIDLRRLRCTGTPTASATRTVTTANRVACVMRVSRLKAMCCRPILPLAGGAMRLAWVRGLPFAGEALGFSNLGGVHLAGSSVATVDGVLPVPTGHS